MLCAELMRGGGVGRDAIYRSKQQWPWREEGRPHGSHGEGGGPWRIIDQGGGEEELGRLGGKDKRREGIMPAGAHTAVEAREEQAKESQQEQQLGREQRFLSPGSGGSHLLRTFLSHPPSPVTSRLASVLLLLSSPPPPILTKHIFTA